MYFSNLQFAKKRDKSNNIVIDGGVEVLLNFAEVQEIADALNFQQLQLATSRVEKDDKTEANDDQRVTEEPVIDTAVVTGYQHQHSSFIIQEMVTNFVFWD